jgi:SAM-dependent methyltransferase
MRKCKEAGLANGSFLPNEDAIAGSDLVPYLSDVTFQRFSGLTSFKEWYAENHWIFDQAVIDAIADHAVKKGILSRFLGPVPHDEIQCLTKNFRESLTARGLNSRLRAELDLFASLPQALDVQNLRIYATEGVTPFAAALRKRYAKFIGSEFTVTAADRERIFPIQHQDLERLTFRADSFDVIFCNEVLEHVPDISVCLREMARVLAPKGVALMTFPFAPFSQITIEKARQKGNEIEYLAEPEYHGNPVNPDVGSLVFQIPAWDIVDTTVDAGFRAAEIIFISSKFAGITAADCAGIFILAARK